MLKRLRAQRPIDFLLLWKVDSLQAFFKKLKIPKIKFLKISQLHNEDTQSHRFHLSNANLRFEIVHQILHN